MDPKSGKPARLFNPFAIWTHFAFKSGEALLESAQNALARRPKVAVLTEAHTSPAKPAAAKVAPAAKGKKRAKRAKKKARRR